MNGKVRCAAVSPDSKVIDLRSSLTRRRCRSLESDLSGTGRTVHWQDVVVVSSGGAEVAVAGTVGDEETGSRAARVESERATAVFAKLRIAAGFVSSLRS